VWSTRGQRGGPRAGLGLALAAALLGCEGEGPGGPVCGAPGGDRPPPHILLISIDSLRADHLEAYGYARETAPALARWAAQGALFEQVVAPSSWTLPSHVSLLTGLPPGVHGVGRHGGRLTDASLTLAEVLQERGYRTGAVVSGPYLQERHGHRQGFDAFDDAAVAHARGGQSLPTVLAGARAFVDDWRGGHADRPFFLFLHVWDVHYDYEPPAPYDRLFDPLYDGDIGGRSFARDPAIHRHMPEVDRRHLLALYDGEMRYTDHGLERFAGELAAQGIDRDLLIAVTSDHGDEFFEHGQKGHGLQLYDEIVRVPWIVRYPRCVAPGQRFDWQVRLMDVAPTLLGLAGVEAPADFGRTGSPVLRARDLSPWLLGSDAPPPPELPGVSTSLLVKGADQTAYRRGGWKLIRQRTPRRTAWRLYDLRSDPEERNDLASSPQTRGPLERMRAGLEAWEAELPEPVLAEPVPAQDQRAELLRALGYVEDEQLQ